MAEGGDGDEGVPLATMTISAVMIQPCRAKKKAMKCSTSLDLTCLFAVAFLVIFARLY